MPLAWADLSRLTRGRRDRLPVWLCLLCVFLVSGFWHGNTWPFVLWGLLQAAYRIGEEVLHKRLGKPKKKAPRPGIVGQAGRGVCAVDLQHGVFLRGFHRRHDHRRLLRLPGGVCEQPEPRSLCRGAVQRESMTASIPMC